MVIEHGGYTKETDFTYLKWWIWQDWNLANRINKVIIKNGFTIVSINYVCIGLLNIVYYQRIKMDIKPNKTSRVK